MNVEREITSWLNAEAPTHAPDRLLKIALDRVAVSPRRARCCAVDQWVSAAARRGRC